MQAHKNKKPNPKELIPFLVAQLAANEEPYAAGAWENFNKRKKRKPLFWLKTAAAILVLGLGLFFLLHLSQKNTIGHNVNVKNKNNKTVLAKQSKQNKAQTILTKHSKKGKPNILKATYSNNLKLLLNKGKAIQNSETINLNLTKKTNKFTDLTSHTVLLQTNKTAKGMRKPSIGDSVTTKNKNYTVVAIVKNDDFNSTNKKITDTTSILITDTNFVKQSTPRPQLAKTKSVTVFDNALLNKVTLQTNKKSSKWLFGLAIAPSFGNTQKLNMGYGLSMEYALSSKIAINSGVLYNQLSTTQNINGATFFAEQGSVRSPDVSVKNLESVSANLSGIDIPLEIKYSFSKSFYANIGMSAFAILNQQRSNSYIEEKIVTQFTTTLTGQQQANNFLSYQRSTEQVADKEIEKLKYLAFYNFSVGFKQKIATKSFVALEPFIKLPIQEISAEKLRLIATGLRIRLNF